MRILISGLLVLLLAGCAAVATGPRFDERVAALESRPDEAMLVVYRPDRVTGGHDLVNISVNRRDRGVMQARGYMLLRLKPGCGEIAIQTQRRGIFSRTGLWLEPGQIEYFRLNYRESFGGWWMSTTPEDEALVELHDLRESADYDSGDPSRMQGCSYGGSLD